MRKLFYMGLEAYNARYTLQLTEWNRRVFERRGYDVVYVPGLTLDNSQKIVTGQVLDAHGRSYFGMSQMMNLVRLMQQGEVTSEDVIYFEDMFQPGIESLPYIIDQCSEENMPRIFVRCLAQSIDPDDFVHVWGMDRWIVPIYNISGLAFGKDEVIERVGGKIKPFNDRRLRVVFSARWDQEKQPDFYMDLIEAWRERFPGKDVEFVVCSGGELKSNNDSYMARTRQMVEDGKLIIYDNLDKNKYYEIVNDSRVVFNCALQDWVSNTVSEADALGCNVLYPAYRSFPETFANDHERMYIPWSIDDAIAKLDILLKKAHPNMGKISDYTDGTIDRICDILEGKGSKYLRISSDYRKHTREAKY